MATITFKVPSIACDGCAKTITEGILSHEPEAQVEVDVTTKVISVKTEASEEAIKQMVTSVGHTAE
ncbi:MAG: heavy-metal-associated domain-containing protein [Symploca sp. SIO1B1]|nr:heavy-metal-associated domain-containing protein [Symploca sp. SIO1A3]NER96215.1 heavy-metal-associated domain-containing protein [Symploca sp. SIO1B1]